MEELGEQTAEEAVRAVEAVEELGGQTVEEVVGAVGAVVELGEQTAEEAAVVRPERRSWRPCLQQPPSLREAVDQEAHVYTWSAVRCIRVYTAHSDKVTPSPGPRLRTGPNLCLLHCCRLALP